MSDEERKSATAAVLKELENGPRSPRDLEARPPAALPPRAVRIAVQTLLDEGHVALNERLKLEPKKA